jgi:hypothetical protein
MSSVGMSLALVHLKGLACAKPAVITPASSKEAVRVLVSTLWEFVLFIATPCA